MYDPLYSCVNQHGSGSYDKTYFLERGARHLFKLVGHVFGEPSDGAEMLGDAELEEVQRVSPRNASRCTARISLIQSPFVSRAIMIMTVGIITIVSLCCYTGVVIFAAFYDCDPVSTKVKRFRRN